MPTPTAPGVPASSLVDILIRLAPDALRPSQSPSLANMAGGPDQALAEVMNALQVASQANAQAAQHPGEFFSPGRVAGEPLVDRQVKAFLDRRANAPADPLAALALVGGEGLAATPLGPDIYRALGFNWDAFKSPPALSNVLGTVQGTSEKLIQRLMGMSR